MTKWICSACDIVGFPCVTHRRGELGYEYYLLHIQAMSHIMNECPLTMLSDGDLHKLYLTDDDAVI